MKGLKVTVRARPSLHASKPPCPNLERLGAGVILLFDRDSIGRT